MQSYVDSSWFEYILSLTNWIFNKSKVNKVSSLIQSFMSHIFNMIEGLFIIEQWNKLAFNINVKKFYPTKRITCPCKVNK